MSYPTKKLLEVGEIITGYTPSKNNKEFWGGNTLFVKPPHLGKGNIVNKTEETLSDLGRKKGKLIKKNSIMVCCIGSLGKIGIAGQDLCTNQQINSIYFNEKIVDFKYGYYYCTTLEREMNLMANQAIIAIINKTSFSKIPIPLPPLPTQKLIVQKLDSSFEKIDKSIELTKKNLENIEELNKSVLTNFFTGYSSDFIGNLVEKTSNWNPKNIGENFFEYIDISSIDNKNYLLTETKYIKGDEAPSRAKQLVNKNDIIFATTRPNLKNIAVIDLDIENLTCSTGFCVLRTIEKKLYYKFLFYYIITDFFQKILTPFIRGAQYPAISDKDLKSLKIPLPPLQKQKEIVAQLDNVFEKNKALKESYEKKLKDLEEMKQSLLKEAFEGRLVKE